MGYIMDLRKLVGTRPLIMPGACVIVLDKDERILLQRRKDNGLWGLAGGSMEPGETLEETAKRELLEETGLTANKLKLFDVFSGLDQYYQYPNGDEVYIVATAYICTDYSGKLVPEETEVEELAFFDLNDLPGNISPPAIPVIKKLKKERSLL